MEGLPAGLKVDEPAPGSLFVAMSGEYDVAAVQALESELDALLARESDAVVVDMSELTFMDTSGIAFLLRIANRFGPIDIRQASPLICRAIGALGLSERLRLGPG